MKNLYIYTMDEKGNLNKLTWEDIKITRDKGQIVTKKSADYKINMGAYKLKGNLDKVMITTSGFPKLKAEYTEYITFDEIEISSFIKKQMQKPFIERYNNEINELQSKIKEIEEMRNKFIVSEEE